jgi:hypothetical protein
MQITDADVLEFQAMCKEQLGLELKWEEAQEQAIKFVRMVATAYRPMSITEFEAIRPGSVRRENENQGNDDESSRQA